jgi:hypothetical protein
MKPESSLPRSLNPAADTSDIYPDPDESNPQLPVLFP